MPKSEKVIDWDIAEALYMQGHNVSQIADKLGCHHSSIQYQIQKHGWEERRENLHQQGLKLAQQAGLKQPKVVIMAEFNSRRKAALDILDELIQKMKELFYATSKETTPEGAVNAILKLMAMKHELEPLSLLDFVRGLIAMGVDPVEFAAQYKREWDLRQGSLAYPGLEGGDPE